MKKLIGILCSLLLPIWVHAADSAPVNGVLTQEHPSYSLQLDSNPTTGYSWFIVSYPRQLVTILHHEYIPPQKNMPGAGGHEIWQFTAKPAAFTAPHVIKIKMVYARPWEMNKSPTPRTFYLATQ